MKNLSNNQGQSLLEAVFAIGILLMVVAVIIGLTLSNLTGQRESEFQIIANNLSREGIEVIRAVRDSNRLAGEKFDKGLNTDNSVVPVFDLNSNEWSLDFSANSIEGDQAIVYRSGAIYNQNSDGQRTAYRRLLTLRDICLEDGREVIKNNCGSGEKVGLKIESQVSCIEGGRKRGLKLEDLLYDWK